MNTQMIHQNQPKGLAQMSGQPTMTSIELRELINAARKEFGEPAVENSHFVKRIEDELEGELGRSKTFRASRTGTPMKGYDLTLEQCLLVGMRESKAVRRSVLAELKKRQEVYPQLPDFTNPVAAARAWADEVEQKQKLQIAYEHAKPAVQFVERYVDGSGLMGFRQVCKKLKAKENEFRNFLLGQKIMYRLNGRLTAYAQHIDAGRFAVKTGVNDQSGHIFTESMFTPKGVSWIAGEWAKYQIQGEL